MHVKTVAIYLVTCAHCAQCLVGSVWTDFLGGKGLDIAIEMPLFMLMSGWFISLDKMRQTPLLTYVGGRFRRLVVPASVFTSLCRGFSLDACGYRPVGVWSCVGEWPFQQCGVDESLWIWR
jgi:hypothetical protein